VSDLINKIDGTAASGKSTVDRLLAQKLIASFLDTGAMYRAVTLAAMQADIDLNDERQLLDITQKCEFRFSISADKTTVHIDNVDVTEHIRKPEVTANARYIAAAPKLREELVKMQRQLAADQRKIVTEGRDQGTVAFSDADFKFYLTADSTERAQRRQKELREKGIEENLRQLQETIEKRDKSDQSRAVGPLKPAEDAIIVDTTDMSIEEVVDKLAGYVNEKCSKNK
jgi:cytidylate kinase